MVFLQKIYLQMLRSFEKGSAYLLCDELGHPLERHRGRLRLHLFGGHGSNCPRRMELVDRLLARKPARQGFGVLPRAPKLRPCTTLRP